MDTFEKSKEIVTKLTLHGHEAYLTGGFVRDLLLSKESSDIDIATSATPDEVNDMFENSKFVGESFGVSLVSIGGESFEVATFRSEKEYTDGRRPDNVKLVKSVKKDASRRDLTVNAIYYDPITNKFLDFFGGIDDINNKRIRFIGKPESRIKEDHLRMIRAIRLASTLDFEIVGDDMKAIRKNSYLIMDIATERIKMEFDKVFNKKSGSRFISLLWASHLLDYILPEVAVLEETKQDPSWHPEGSVLVHTIRTLAKLETDDICTHWAALLHDIGKATTTALEDGKVRSKGHEKVSKELASNILERFRFSKKESDEILYLVENHMKPVVANKMKLSNVKKLVHKGPANELVKLAKADCLSTGREDIDFSGIDKLEKVLTMPSNLNKPDPILSGRDLIDLGYSPGPLFKEILDYVYDKQLNGEIDNRDDAMGVVVKRW